MRISAMQNNSEKYTSDIAIYDGQIETDETQGTIQALQAPNWMQIGQTLINAFAQTIQRAERTKASYAASAKHLFSFLASVGASRCSAFEVAQFYMHLKAKVDEGELKAATMAAYIQAAGRIIEWGRVQAQTADDWNGTKGINQGQYAALFPGKPFAEKPKVETFKGHKRCGLSVQETDAFLNYFETQIKDEYGVKQCDRIARRNRCMMYLMNELGLRCVELVRLRLRDVQSEGRNLRIGITHKGKSTPCPKYIDKDFQTAVYLWNWKRERIEIDNAKESDFLFVSMSNRTPHSSKPTTTRTVENICVAALQTIGVKCEQITTHSIRHSFATQALESVPLSERMQAAREIQETMGHSSLDITLTNYAHDIDSKESRIRHIREAQRLERLRLESMPKDEPKRRGRPKGSTNKTKKSDKKRGK